MTRRSSDYLMTIDMSNPLANEEIALVRRAVRTVNKRNRESGNSDRFFVRVCGRLGKNNPNAPLYRVGGPLWRSSCLNIKLEHSSRVDLYVSKRYPNWN